MFVAVMVTVTDVGVTEVGVPVISPLAELKFRPLGNDPVIDQVSIGPPVLTGVTPDTAVFLVRVNGESG